MFYDGFVKLCNERNTTPTAVMKALNLSTGSPAGWKQGRTPTTNTMQKIADYFGVTNQSVPVAFATQRITQSPTLACKGFGL